MNLRSISITDLPGILNLFLEMGYKKDTIHPMLLKLSCPFVIDRVMTVARDCLLARLECQMLTDIHEKVSSELPITVEMVLHFRQGQIGSVDVCVQSLLSTQKHSLEARNNNLFCMKRN